jgi:hypothetical protein
MSGSAGPGGGGRGGDWERRSSSGSSSKVALRHSRSVLIFLTASEGRWETCGGADDCGLEDGEDISLGVGEDSQLLVTRRRCSINWFTWCSGWGQMVDLLWRGMG